MIIYTARFYSNCINRLSYREFSIHRFLVVLLVIVITILQTGCVQIPIYHQADEYFPSADNALLLKRAGDFKVKIGNFSSTVQDGSTRFRCITGLEGEIKDEIQSPYENSFAKYLEWAAYIDFFHADKIAPDVDVELSAVLIKNDICIPVLTGSNSVTIDARFIVRKAGEIRYDQIKSVHQEWSPGGAVFLVVPSEFRAEKEYPLAVQKLMATLYADEAFISALK